MLILVLFLSLAIFLLAGVPIAIALGCSSLLALVLEGNTPLIVIGQRMIAANDSFPLLAVPFFMFAGAIMTQGGISNRLVTFAQTIVGRIRGGLAMVATLAAMFFAAISGSSAATTAAIGGCLITEMKKRKYDDDFAAASIAAAGTTGIVIPPSTPMVVYGVVTNTSIGKLFLGGFIPGIMMGLAMMIVIFFQATKRGYKGEPPVKVRDVFIAFKDAILGLMMPIIILGGIYAGVFTPTESAAVACAYGIIVALFVYKEVKFKDLMKIFMDSVKATALTTFILNTAAVFAWILVANNIPQRMAASLIALTDNRHIIMLLINILLLFVGTFLNATAAVSILAPILYPVVVGVGMDPIAFGVIMVVNLAIGCITPPVGVDLFVAQSVSGVGLVKIVKAVIPPMIALLIVLGIITTFPQLIMLLPNLFKG